MAEAGGSSADMQEIERLISSFSTAMLVTESCDGDLRARPMAIAGRHEPAMLYFLTRREDEKLKELAHRADVSVVMQRNDQYLSISGRARLVDDSDLVEQAWSASARLWFPQGPEDPNVELFCVEPGFAESWDRTGIRKLEFWWKAGKALLHKEKAADQKLSGHKKVKL